jgi:uncharacterized membrane protein
LAEVGVAELGKAEEGVAEVGVAEVCEVEVGLAEVGATEVDAAEVRIFLALRAFVAFLTSFIPFRDSCLTTSEQLDGFIAVHVNDLR